MIDHEKRLKKFKNQPFSYQEALKQGVSRHDLIKLLSENKIERVSRGLYRNAGCDISEEIQFIEATKILGRPSAVCLESALIYHNLTDDILFDKWMLVPELKRTTVANIRLWRSPKPQWNIGIRKTPHYWVTTVERTIVDCIAHPTLSGEGTGISALARCLNSKKTSLESILETAQKLGHENKIREITKIMSYSDVRSI